ncbi:hypothetical protein MCOR04_004284 [Pyricularia oryzae]|uniref:Thioredoxin domain-containing protein n=3 Tax=Pyricularia TaxID=48558 RepID=A0ABQ8NFI7_PYRGI|nr:hypothetical protein MCOR33_007068 [Pyricularia grisea]KAI6587651.1 hypothetical protein MCOR04_004284 [Pyricularia oryzae]
MGDIRSVTSQNSYFPFRTHQKPLWQKHNKVSTSIRSQISFSPASCKLVADKPQRPPPNSAKMVHNVRTKEEFQEALKKYPTVVVDFYSTNSDESKQIAATFAHANELDKFKDFRFVKVDIDDLKAVAEEVGVSKPATFHMYKNGQKTNDLQSNQQDDLIKFLETGL